MKNNLRKNRVVTEEYLDKVLVNYPTKKDLNQALLNYPTKKDLDEKLLNYPTKKDLNEALSNYPTKTDLNEALKNYPTKKDLNKSLKSLENRIINKINQVLQFIENETYPLKNRVNRIENHLQLPTLSS